MEIVGENLDDALHQVFLGDGIPTINDLKRVKNKPKRGMCNWCVTVMNLVVETVIIFDDAIVKTVFQ